LKRLARDRIVFRKWPRTQRCKVIGIDKEEEEEEEEEKEEDILRVFQFGVCTPTG
jgi:hypothetical protein